MNYDPRQRIKPLIDYEISMDRTAEFAQTFKDRALQGRGHGILGTCVACFLAGLFEVGRELLPKSRDFLRAAIEHKEIPRYYFRGGTEARRLELFAICQWFLERKHDLKSYMEAVKWHEVWFTEYGRPDKTTAQYALPVYLEAGAYDVLFHRFAVAGLKPPKNLKQIKGEGTMSYVLARQRVGLEYTAEQVQLALESFLKRNIPDWLKRYNTDAAARWMKIAFWKPGDDPIATLLKCYDYLPGVEPPKYL